MENNKNNSSKKTNTSSYGYQPYKPQNRGYQPNANISANPPKPPKGTSGNDAK